MSLVFVLGMVSYAIPIIEEKTISTETMEVGVKARVFNPAELSMVIDIKLVI